MKPLSRSFATVSKGPAARRLRGQRVLGLEHFVQRQRVLTLWRDILRTTAFIPDPGLRKDMRQTAREKFEQHRNVTDLGHIRYLISTGKTEFSAMKGTLINSGCLTDPRA